MECLRGSRRTRDLLVLARALLSLAEERLVCRPMKGTAARGYWAEQDDMLGRALRASEKNRAENVMIVDMVRNDIGRIAKTGTVKVDVAVRRRTLSRPVADDLDGRRYRRDAIAAPDVGGDVPVGLDHRCPQAQRDGNHQRSRDDATRHLHRGDRVRLPARPLPFQRCDPIRGDRPRQGTAELGVGSGIVWDSVDRDESDECLLKARVIGPRRRAVAALALIRDPRFARIRALGDDLVDARGRVRPARPPPRAARRVRGLFRCAGDPRRCGACSPRPSATCGDPPRCGSCSKPTKGSCAKRSIWSLEGTDAGGDGG